MPLSKENFYFSNLNEMFSSVSLLFLLQILKQTFMHFTEKQMLTSCKVINVQRLFRWSSETGWNGMRNCGFKCSLFIELMKYNDYICRRFLKVWRTNSKLWDLLLLVLYAISFCFYSFVFLCAWIPSHLSFWLEYSRQVMRWILVISEENLLKK